MRSKNIFLVLMGFMPLVAGLLMNFFINKFNMYILSYGLIGIVFVVTWGGLGVIVGSKFKENIKITFGLMHLPMFLALILNLYQHIILDYYMIGVIGIF